MITPILATKLYIPPPGSDRLSRPRLLHHLDEGLLPGRPLILVCAPAGYGKTTLLSEWASTQRQEGVRFAWLSLEDADNDFIRFFAYLAAALEKHVPGLVRLIEDLLAAPQPPSPPDLAATLVNPLASFAGSLVIVLDDVQAIHDPNLSAALLFLVEHLPPQVHLALASRSDPPLPLHRLRARGQLVELRLNELRFDREETAELLHLSSPAHLKEEDAALLEERTEGWAAGLRMALLSIRGKEDPSRFLHNLSGSQRYILDYLAEEVLRGQCQEVQDFLIETAILDRFNAELCEALVFSGLDRGLTGDRFASSQILEYLDRSNLFLIPLDDERNWYRYHHLFADLLRVRLKQRVQHQPGLLETLHSRAAAWLEENNFSEDAVHHALWAGDFDRAARIVERSTLDLFARGRLHQLLAWIHMLPEETAAQRPWLDVYQAWALAFASRIPEAEAHLNSRRSCDPGRPGTDAHPDRSPCNPQPDRHHQRQPSGRALAGRIAG